MKNKTPEDFIQNLRQVAQSKTEAQSMRERLIAYADMHEFVPASSRSARVSSFSYLFMHYSRPLIAGALVLVLLIGGTGVTYAAQDSLPGQPLYDLKVDVAEPIQTALITTPAAKAQWENTLATRRLSEASTLAAEGDLATSTQEYLADAVATHVQLSEQAADTLDASGDTDAALAARSDLEARLSAHADVLALMTARFDADGEASSTDTVLALLTDLQAQRTAVEMAREATEAVLSDTASSTASSSADEHAVVVAYVSNENQDLHTEESTMFRKEATQFGLFVPAAAPAISSSTATSTATSTPGSVATSSPAFPWYRLIPPFMASSTITVPTDNTTDSSGSN